MERTVLIVEDEPSIAKLIKYNIEKAGFIAELATNGERAVAMTLEKEFDLVILDVMLPKMDGIEVCQRIRERDNVIPIIMLTAKIDEADKIHGLNIGADDYITKPFSPKELLARMNVLLRRIEQSTQEKRSLRVGEIEINSEKYQAYLRGDLLDLTKKEFEFLVYLIEHKNQVLSRQQLLSAVWNYDFVGDTRIVDVHVSHLRDKIELDKKQPQYIKTIRGYGYMMEDLK